MKKRLFYLDFIRAISTFIIVLTHYNALFLFDAPGHLELTVGGAFISNIYIGTFGVGLFLIISGAALMHVYGNRESINWKKFYIKRFTTLFPSFWIAYILVFLYSFFKFKAIPSTIPFASLLLSAIGMDGYLSNFGVPVFYYIGEWFLGFIIILYLIFPLLIWSAKKYPIALAGATTVLFVLGLIFLRDQPWFGVSLPFNLIFFVFGMLFVKYVKNVHISVALSSALIFIINHFLKPTSSNPDIAKALSFIQPVYVCLSAFVFLVWISNFIKCAPVVRICSTICKYSYPCFIIHHWLTREIALTFNLPYLNNTTSNLLFITCCIAIGFASVGLYHLTEKIVAYVKHVFAKTEKKAETCAPVDEKPQSEPVAEKATEPAPTTTN